jgi:hypothetical protein
MAVRLSASALTPLYPQEDSWYSFLFEAESTPKATGHFKGLVQFKKSNDLMAYRTRDLFFYNYAGGLWVLRSLLAYCTSPG